MIEVLVSMVVIMVGALGIAGMQLLAITSTENARYQNVAVMLGTSLSASMQANVAYWGTPPGSISVSGSTITPGPTFPVGSCDGAASTCTPTQLAGADLLQWSNSVAASLPGGNATITCPGAVSPAICSVTISWLERNVSLQNKSGTETGDLKSGGREIHTYQTLVSIL